MRPCFHEDPEVAIVTPEDLVGVDPVPPEEIGTIVCFPEEDGEDEGSNSEGS